MAIWIVREFLSFWKTSCAYAGEVRWSNVWLAQIDPSVSAMVICSIERETRACQRQNLYADTLENMLEPLMEQLNRNNRMFCAALGRRRIDIWMGLRDDSLSVDFFE